MITWADLAVRKRLQSTAAWFGLLYLPAARHPGCGRCGRNLITDWTFSGSIYTSLHADSLHITQVWPVNVRVPITQIHISCHPHRLLDKELVHHLKIGSINGRKKSFFFNQNYPSFPFLLFSYIQSLHPNVILQECSPYAAHLYDAEDANTPMRMLPGLCGDYCSDYWHQCRYTLSLLLEDLGVLHQFSNLTAVIEEDRRKFCEFLELKDKQYCYPSVVSNTGTMHECKAVIKLVCTYPGSSLINQSLNSLANGSGVESSSQDKGNQRQCQLCIFCGAEFRSAFDALIGRMSTAPPPWNEIPKQRHWSNSQFWNMIYSNTSRLLGIQWEQQDWATHRHQYTNFISWCWHAKNRNFTNI